MPEAPPKLAVWLVTHLVGGRDAEAVLGDLRETFEYRGGGRLWFWGQALSCMAVRLSWHRRALPAIGTDFHRALRRIRRNPGYAVTAMLCLGLAMGVNTILFSFLDSLLYRELPVPEGSRIAIVSRESTPFCSWPEYLEVRRQIRSFDAAATLPASALFDIDHSSLRVTIEAVSANYAGVLRLGTSMGRWFPPAQDGGDGEPAVVISHQLWTSKLQRDPAIVGRRVLVEEMPFRVIGIGPPGFTGTSPPLATDIWVSAGALAGSSDIRASRTRVDLVVRLAAGATLQAATAEARVISSRLKALDPSNPVYSDPIHVERAAGFLWARGRRGLTSITSFACGLCGIVLLIACVNVGNLLLSRATVRRKDLALQQALGASQSRLFREVFVEGLVLAAGGLAAGTVAGQWIARAIAAALPDIPIASGVSVRLDLDWRIALALAVAGSFSAILFSLPPALESGRHHISNFLKPSGGFSRKRELYSLAQVALSLTLLVAAIMTERAMSRAQHADLGFATDHRLYVTLFTSAKRHEPENASQEFTKSLEAARQLPGVLSATLASGPVGPGPGSCASPTPSVRPRRMSANVVDPTYFDVMRLQLVKGRAFTSAETGPAETGIVVSEALAKFWWPGDEALGRNVWLGCAPSARRIARVIGVARDTRRATDMEPQRAYYISRLQDPGTGAFGLIVRTAGDPAQWKKALMDAVRRSAPDLRVYETQTLEEARAASTWAIRWQTSLLGWLSILAMLLAVVGLYGVVAFSVSQRTGEIGVRMALGATRSDVEWMVITQGLRIVVPGVVVGMIISGGTAPLLGRYLSGVGPLDGASLSAAAVVWMIVAMLASWYPASRATRLDPLAALRYE